MQRGEFITGGGRDVSEGGSPLDRGDGWGQAASEAELEGPVPEQPGWHAEAMAVDDLYPVTIVRSRYGAIYEPGRWLAFSATPENLPPEWHADDATCAAFYAERSGEIGGGASPDAAYVDLQCLLRARRDRLHPSD